MVWNCILSSPGPSSTPRSTCSPLKPSHEILQSSETDHMRVILDKPRDFSEPASSAGSSAVLAVVQLPSHVQLFTMPWTVARQASLSLTISRTLSKFMSIESVTPSNHLILCHPLLLLILIFPSIRVFSNESAVRIR